MTEDNDRQGLGLKPLDASHLAADERTEATHFVI